MAAYMGNPPYNPVAAASAPHDEVSHRAQYHPQEPMISGGMGGPINMGADHLYNEPLGQPMSDVHEFGPAPNVYYPPPQAPRLTAAAARASSFAAMYYDPTLHPQHIYNSNTSQPYPWMTSYVGNEYGPGAPYHHHHLEQHLIRQNQLSRINQNGGGHYYPENGSQRTGSEDPHAVGGPVLPPQGHQPYVPDQWSQHWPIQRHQPYHPVAATQPNTPSDYRTFPQTNPNYSTADEVLVRSSAGSALPMQAWHYENGAQPFHGWNVQDAQHAVDQRAPWPWSASQAENTWVSQNSCPNWSDQAPRYPGAPQALGWHAPPPYVLGANMPPGQQYDPREASKCSIWNHQQQPNGHAPQMLPDKDGHADGVHVQKPPAPAPPSPGTLDKSAVPTSAQGAEIVWIAAAALLDRSLLQIFHQRAHVESAFPRSCPSSPGSRGTASPAITTSCQGKIGDVHEQRSDVMEDSSASSSEPSTPPATGIRHGVRQKPSFGTLDDPMPIGVEVENNASLSPGKLNGTKELRPRPFYRSASHDRAKDAVYSISELSCAEWRWSNYEDKLESLAHFGRVNQNDLKLPSWTPTCEQQRIGNGDEANKLPTSTTIPISGTEPSPAFRRFAHQVLAQTLVSPTAFLLGLMYSLRVLQIGVIHSASNEVQLDPEVVEVFAQPPSAAPFKLFTLGLMIANKHLDDNTFLNKTWHEVTGISLPELNRMERWYLERCSYEINVPISTWTAFLESIKLRTEGNLNASLGTAKRFQVPLGRSSDTRSNQNARLSQSTLKHASKSHSASAEDGYKRFLSDTEEALQSLGRLPPFDLTALNTW